MMDAIARMISSEVRPLVDEILDLRTELEDLRGALKTPSASASSSRLTPAPAARWSGMGT